MNRNFRLALIDSQINSVENLSVVVGIERTRLCRIENGRVRPRPDECARISAALDVPVQQLFPAASGGAGTEKAPDEPGNAEG